MFRSIFAAILNFFSGKKTTPQTAKVYKPKGNWRITLHTGEGKKLFIGYGRKSFFAKIEELLRLGFRRYQIFAFQRNQHGMCYRFSVLRYQLSECFYIARESNRWISLRSMGVSDAGLVWNF